MIIKISKPDSKWRASLQGDACLTLGYGNSEKEAIGDLIFTLAGAADSIKATENIDIRIIVE